MGDLSQGPAMLAEESTAGEHLGELGAVRAAFGRRVDSVFDGVAMLQALESRLQLLALEGDIHYDVGLMLARVARRTAAQLEADAGALMEFHVVGELPTDGAEGGGNELPV